MVYSPWQTGPALPSAVAPAGSRGVSARPANPGGRSRYQDTSITESLPADVPQLLLPAAILSSREGFHAAAQPSPAQPGGSGRAIHVPKGPQAPAGLGVSWSAGHGAVTLRGCRGLWDGEASGIALCQAPHLTPAQRRAGYFWLYSRPQRRGVPRLPVAQAVWGDSGWEARSGHKLWQMLPPTHLPLPTRANHTRFRSPGALGGPLRAGHPGKVPPAPERTGSPCPFPRHFPAAQGAVRAVCSERARAILAARVQTVSPLLVRVHGPACCCVHPASPCRGQTTPRSL